RRYPFFRKRLSAASGKRVRMHAGGGYGMSGMTLGMAILALVLAYLLGSVAGGLVLGRLAGVNLRSVGSGNAGATNAVRAKGPLFGVAVFVFDAAKGVVAVLVLPLLAAGLAWLPVACAGAVIVGHVFPLWYGFR